MPDEPALPPADAAFSGALSEYKQPDVEHLRRGIALAVLSAIPWVGGFMSSAAGAKAAMDQTKIDSLLSQWMEEHARKIQELSDTLDDMFNRLTSLGADTIKRMESPEFLALIRSGFRQWDQADSDEKKRLIVNLLTNAGATKITSDDIVQLFLDWLKLYHEIHFSVIRAVHQNEGITRHGIWEKIHGTFPREDSAEADLFKLMVRDLTIGGVIRQHRETDYDGKFLRKPKSKPVPGGKPTVSAFDDEEGYVLTALGRQFVHYTMNEVVPRVQ